MPKLKTRFIRPPTSRPSSTSPGGSAITVVLRGDGDIAILYGADACVDHRAATFIQQLSAELTNGAQLVFDTVGGPIADAVFDNLAPHIVRN